VGERFGRAPRPLRRRGGGHPRRTGRGPGEGCGRAERRRGRSGRPCRGSGGRRQGARRGRGRGRPSRRASAVGRPRLDLDDDPPRVVRAGAGLDPKRRGQRGSIVAARPRVPPADALHARGGRRDPCARASRPGRPHAERRRGGRPSRPARHVRRQDPVDPRGACRGRATRVRDESRRGRGARPRLLGDPRARVSRPARRARVARRDGRARGSRYRDADGAGGRPRASQRREPARGLPGGAALAGGDAAARGPARSIPAAGRDRVRARRQRRQGDEGLRDPGGDHVPRRRRGGVRGPRAAPARA
jgi:hypothetical protein